MNKIEILNEFIEKYQVNNFKETNPKLLKEIFENDFNLDSHLPLVKFIEPKMNLPQDLTSFVNEIKGGLLEFHPAIIEFINELVQQNLISTESLNNATVERALNKIYLHNEILIFGDNDFNQEYGLINHMLEKRRNYGVRSNPILSWFDIFKVLKLEKTWYKRAFWVIKIKSVDWVIKIMFIGRVKNGSPQKLNLFRRIFGVGALKVNIIEAVICDFASGNFKNGLAGLSLILILPKFCRARASDLSKTEFGYSQEWSSLYHTWNLAYVTGTGVHFISDKLLQPMVNNKSSSRYMHTRVIALNNALNTMLYNGDNPSVFSPIKNIDEIMKIWGGINLKYASQLLKKTYGLQTPKKTAYNYAEIKKD